MTDFGPSMTDRGAMFCVRAADAEGVDLCVFDAREREERLAMTQEADGAWRITVPALGDGARYGFRAAGRFAPDDGLWFDHAKLLVDPLAIEIDRPFRYDAALGRYGAETRDLVPKCVLRTAPPLAQRRAEPLPAGALIYETPPKAFSMLHPAIPAEQRGTLAALESEVALAHFVKLGVHAVELMPLVAWIDERHLPPLGLSNAWGYNPVALCALDPRLAPGGLTDLRRLADTLHARGVALILDVVFNHTGESDASGPTLSMRGLDNRMWYRRHADGVYVNDTGCGNSLDCSHDIVARHIMQALRRLVEWCGVDGFRFDLGAALTRTAEGFDGRGGLFASILADETLKTCTHIIEPWDVGPGGYRLGAFRPPILEWNDLYRDDVRRFWRGDRGAAGAFATRLAGSSDVFTDGVARTVNFVAAHDGFTLRDAVSYAFKHNLANGEDNRDGADQNFSCNHGVEGESSDPHVLARRTMAVRAMLASLFASRGAIMLTAGDEFGRTQSGNNNAYAQDNALTWLDWTNRDTALEDFVARLSAWRRSSRLFDDDKHFDASGRADEMRIEWLRSDGAPMQAHDWSEATRFVMRLSQPAMSQSIAFDSAALIVEFEPPIGL
jgi:glycogen operon protein